MMKWLLRSGVLGFGLYCAMATGDVFGALMSISALVYLVVRAAPAIAEDARRFWAWSERVRAPRRQLRGGADL